MALPPGVKINISWRRFWFAKLKQQLQNIKNKNPENYIREEPEIALGYFFLYQWLESFIDDIVSQFCDYLYPIERIKKFEDYKQKPLYLKGKVEFLFDNFCPELSYQDYLQVKNELKPLNKIRNLIIHLHEISWVIDDKGKTEQPKSKLAKILKKEDLDNSYNKSINFLALLRQTLAKSRIGQQRWIAGPSMVDQVFDGWLDDEVKEKIKNRR